MIASGVGVVSNLSQGNWKGAAVAAIGLTGLGAVAAAAKLASRAGLGTKIASTAWTASSRGSGKANLLYHYEKHGASMGYRSPLTYTLGAAANIVKSRSIGTLLSSGSRSFVSRSNVTLTYKGKLSNYLSVKKPSKYR